MVLRRTAIAAALVAAPLAFAAPAMAQPTTDIQCAPCIPPSDTPVWTDFFETNAVWEPIFDPAGDGNGAWEQGVTAINGGAWEKAFPPAE
jgi:hypothetical protein